MQAGKTTLTFFIFIFYLYDTIYYSIDVVGTQNVI